MPGLNEAAKGLKGMRLSYFFDMGGGVDLVDISEAPTSGRRAMACTVILGVANTCCASFCGVPSGNEVGSIEMRSLSCQPHRLSRESLESHTAGQQTAE